MQTFSFKALVFLTIGISIHARAFHCPTEPSTQMEMNDCAAQGYEKVNKELNKVYADYRKRLSNTQKLILKDTQLAWIKYRDLACEFESSGAEGGSVRPMVRNYCLAGKARVRLNELEQLASCEEQSEECPAGK